MQGRALGTQPAKVSGMIGITFHIGNLRPIAFDQNSAAHTAIGAGCLCRSHELAYLFLRGLRRCPRCRIEEYHALFNFARVTASATFIRFDHFSIVEIDRPVV